MSAVAVPMLLLWGYFCSQKMLVMQIPDANKADAGKGCYMAAAMYAVTFVVAYQSMNSKKASARELKA
eukprot:CAMPEP_0198543568 /NCGR_PEP_ID=MMETSP1462-20131121/59735_1 /TAXON_ID=1333877 /ORGANISM="Brandtodinium nutriculum, Strain RCC3387" /LENGTH=67 /DNA_ID=CAMNT_0044273855 /DNA_START=150 /DNA_END=353 /DNA_ORIENTATION=-